MVFNHPQKIANCIGLQEAFASETGKVNKTTLSVCFKPAPATCVTGLETKPTKAADVTQD